MVVCHLLPCEAQEGVVLVNRIKLALASNFSPVLTFSIGMAPTELLAKIDAEMNKPDGFSLINVAELPGKLAHLPLDNLPGISTGIEARFKAAGVEGFSALWDLAPKQARGIWGNVESARFWNGLLGYHVERPEMKKGMFGHSRILPVDWRSPEKVRVCARQLAISATRRLRRADVRATKLTLGLRGGYRGTPSSRKDVQRWQWESSFQPVRDDRTILSVLSDGLLQSLQEVNFKPKSVSVMLHALAKDGDITQDLFAAQIDGADPSASKQRQEHWEGLSVLMDQLRSAHGPKALSLRPVDEAAGGYLGAKIAFGTIPDAEDFSGEPVADEDTHFCSV